MTSTTRRALAWAPRALCIAFILFISLFALDVFGRGAGFWRTLVDLCLHLIPSFVLAAMLILAWRWEWIGALMSASLGVLFLWWNSNYRHNASVDVLIIAGPLFALAVLYLLNWLMRRELHGET
jgi:glucose-6-phosphate-specific signal transduction histidine kinase